MESSGHPPAAQEQQPGAARGASPPAAAAAATPAADGPNAAAPGPGSAARVLCFSETTPSDGRLDFQVIDLGRQLYVWVALGGAKMSNLCFSIQAPSQAGAPATAVLLRGNAGVSGEGLASRLAMRLKRPVLCSCNIPPSADVLQVAAERRLLRELLGTPATAAGGGGGSGAAAAAAAAVS
ncbi:hypothetical protein Rsub_02248 [Raphidocelis subcapitata]|uniref:Proteasome assembly chaperone 4 n=1 Tax=Raphidocelis subcapitata TaxID=307507 RepID=A0A2V0NVD3_9CHLO|nr:hypothetical protein Rsub_02248 [Raphidocelis subcapitata]|eukprot:GBF89530.1 hypothetical protein Rsub_02248 [Raphidocelis subcapitata]